MTGTSVATKDIVIARGRFRARATELLASAKAALHTEDDALLDVAAMRLRKAFECLTYECAKIYFDELTLQDLAIWQPRKLMDRLIEIDPLVGLDLEMSFQDTSTGDWISLGKQNSLNVKDIKRNYGELSRLIHDPSLQDLVVGRPDRSSASRQACDIAVGRLDRILQSTLWNVAVPSGGFITFACSACGAAVRRRLTALVEGPHRRNSPITADCPSCPASFNVEVMVDKEISWSENLIDVSCPNPNCGEPLLVWPRQCREGHKIACSSCNETSTIKRLWVLERSSPKEPSIS